MKLLALRKRGEFLRVQGTGRRVRRKFIVAITSSNQTSVTRVGFTVSRKVGGAVVRNRVRRRLRALVQAHQALLGEGIDYVIVAFPDAAQATFAALEEDLTWVLRRSIS